MNGKDCKIDDFVLFTPYNDVRTSAFAEAEAMVARITHIDTQ